MLEQTLHIRRSIVPDTSVRILDICLASDENEILMPPISRSAKMLDFRADVTLKDMISQKIYNKEFAIPINLRKRKLYEIYLESNKNGKDVINNDLENLLSLGAVPILMRKHLFCMQSRAG